MPDTRYFVLARKGAHVAELFKLVQRSSSAVIASPLLKRLVTVKGIHVTHHPPKRGRGTRIVHVTDGAGTDERIPLDPAADPVELPRVVVDLSGFDWANTRPFAKRSYAEKYVLDVEQGGPYIDARFYFGSPNLLLATMDAVTAAPDESIMIVPKPDGFGTLPGGHTINFARVVFDDEADMTLGCLLCTCHPPDGDPGPGKPWSLGPLQYVAYGGGEGEYATGSVE